MSTKKLNIDNLSTNFLTSNNINIYITISSILNYSKLTIEPQMTFTPKKPTVKIEDAILADFMELLDNQQLDNVWTKEWTSSKSQGHINFLTGHAYSGANPIILEMYQTLRGQELPLWVGYGQAKKDLNCIPKKGSKAAKILRPNPIKIDLKNEDGSPKLDNEGNQEFIMKVTFKGASVFNISDLVGLDDKAQSKLDKIIESFKADCKKSERPLSERCKDAYDRLMIYSKDLKDGIKHRGDKAYYTEDYVVMPPRESFVNDEAYLATLAHEFAHSTGTKDRLNRKWFHEYGTYRGLEEMTAEFTAVLVSNRLQITCNTQNHAAYLSGWAKAVKNSKSPSQALMKVFSNAVKAADMIIGEQ